MDAFTILNAKATLLSGLFKQADDTSTATALGRLGTIGGGLSAGTGALGQRLGQNYLLNNPAAVAEEGASAIGARLRALAGGNSPPQFALPTKVRLSQFFAPKGTSFLRSALGGQGGGRAMMRGGGTAAAIGAPLWLAGRSLDRSQAETRSLKDLLAQSQNQQAEQLPARVATANNLKDVAGDAAKGLMARISRRYDGGEG